MGNISTFLDVKIFYLLFRLSIDVDCRGCLHKQLQEIFTDRNPYSWITLEGQDDVQSVLVNEDMPVHCER